MKKSYLPMMLGLLGSLLLSTAAFAGADFSTLDANQDGSLSAEEAAVDVDLSSNWSDIDKDENGMIDQAEFSAFEEMQGGTTSEQPAAKE
jgi:hypothetical protein